MSLVVSNLLGPALADAATRPPTKAMWAQDVAACLATMPGLAAVSALSTFGQALPTVAEDWRCA